MAKLSGLREKEVDQFPTYVLLHSIYISQIFLRQLSTPCWDLRAFFVVRTLKKIQNLKVCSLEQIFRLG